jgi:hypothetical protein
LNNLENEKSKLLKDNVLLLQLNENVKSKIQEIEQKLEREEVLKSSDFIKREQ